MLTMTILIIILFSLRVTAPVQRCLYIERMPTINPYERIYEATGYVESRFDDNAIGDKHLKQHSYGRVQTRQSRLNDYYQQTGKAYNVTFMWVEEYSREVFMHYASQIDYRDSERISREWNGGAKGMKKKATKKYWDLIQKQMR